MGIAIICPDEDFSTYKKTFQVHPVEDLAATAMSVVGPDTLDDATNQAKMNVSLTPFNTPYRTVNWMILEGGDYASIAPNGMITAKYYAADPDAAHNVKIQATHAKYPSLVDTKVVSVKCHYVDGAVTIDGLLERPMYDGGHSFIIQGMVDGEKSTLVRFRQPASKDTTASKPSTLADKFTLVDNMDGTATVTILTEDYLHQIELSAYNEANPSKTWTQRINVNDIVILLRSASENSAELLNVFYANGMCADPDKMYQSEAYVVTTI